jgi:hypothetical protein
MRDSQNQFILYNIDGSIYKTINMPQKPDPSASIYELRYVTTSLFDNDPSNIEYLIEYKWDSAFNSKYHQVKVLREDGTVLLDEMNATCYWIFPSIIYGTEEGTKLILHYQFAEGLFYQIIVFNLPGDPPVEVNNSQNTNELVVYPNPNNGSFSIKLNSNENKESIIDVYTSEGKLIDTFKSVNNVNRINSILPEGLYFININADGTFYRSKMIINK